MASPADSLLKCSFDAIRFPIFSVRVRGGMRDHEHVYPHSPGAAPEKLGRELYKIEIVPCFDARMIQKEYVGLWPERLHELRSLFETGKTADLILPTIGKIRAYATKWEQEFNAARSLSGEAVSWSFTEDSENARLIDSTFKLAKNLEQANKLFGEAGARLSLIDKISDAWDMVTQGISQVLAYRDQYQLYASLIEAKLVSILNLLEEIDNASDELKNPRNSFAVEALMEVWSQTRAFYNDQKQAQLLTRHRKTKIDMDVGQVAVWLFGDSEKASELVALNAFPDPYDIKAGTDVRYYELVL